MKKELYSGLVLVGFLFISLSYSGIANGGAAANEGGSHWIYMEGSEISPGTINGPANNFPAYIMGESTNNNRCLANAFLFKEGYVRDVGSFNEDLGLQFEAGGWMGDVEICINNGEGENVVTGGPSQSDNYRGGDHGGEWNDLDSNSVNQYVRNNKGSLGSDAWRNYWINNVPDAHPSTWDGEIGEHGEEGFAVEDDCGPQNCDDIGTGTGQESPFALHPGDAFTEGGGDDDHSTRGHAEITGESPSTGLDNLHNRVQAGNLGSGSYTGVGNGNSQDVENPATRLSWNENSHIDPRDDEWALTPSLNYAIDYDGEPYAPGSCYGAPRQQGVDKTKAQAVYANSYAHSKDVYGGGSSGGRTDGVWVNPDDLDDSVLSGGFSCDLTGKDWGYGFADSGISTVNCEQPSSGACDKEGNPNSPGDEGVLNSFPHAIEGEMIFDYEDDPGSYNQDNLPQFPDACGDDQNEYLIREHAATQGGENNPEFDGRNDYYGCADRPTDCVFQGEVYSQGELIDIQDEEAGENGVDAYDDEICVHLDPNIPGGEWVDVDNESIRSFLIGSGTSADPEYYVRKESPNPSDPGKTVWHDGTESGTHNEAAREAMISPFNPIDYQTGYALEDDCDPAIADEGSDMGCDDSGFDEELIQGDYVYSPFNEMKSDDHNVFDTYAVRMYVGDGSGEDASGSHGQNNGQDQENVPASVNFDFTKDGTTVELNDSEIDPLEDTWAISNRTNAVVGPTGRTFWHGQCYGTPALADTDLYVDKGERVVGNSFARSIDFNSDGDKEGVWVDPDTTEQTTLAGGTSCDLNGTDWGIGYNNGSGKYVTDNNSEPRYEPTDLHVVTGNVTFDINSDPNGIGASRNLQQYPNTCGDDRNEYLIREHDDSIEETEQQPNLDQENTYVCADRISDCAFNGGVYSQGQLVDIQSQQREESGADSIDEEVCVDADPTIPGGEWYDVDNESINQLLKGSEGTYAKDTPSSYEGVVRDNASYSGDGVKWFTEDYTHAEEVEISPFNPLNYSDGYALEDDVGPGIEYSSDEGPTEQRFTPDAVYSYFEDGHIEDDRLASLVDGGTEEEILEGDLFKGVSVQMKVGWANGTAYSHHGATNDQDQENVPPTVDFEVTKWGKTVPLNDSTIDPLEDTWAIANSTDAVIDPTGAVYQNGTCYGSNPWEDSTRDWITKGDTVVGNSYAMSMQVDNDDSDQRKGVWVNPDSTPKSVLTAGTDCDLNATDWGVGYDQGGGSGLTVIEGSGTEFGDVRQQGYDPDDPHVVAGDIQFENKKSWEDESDTEFSEDIPPQYGDTCGDDRYEYLIREHNSTDPTSFEDEHDPSLQRDNIYVCATDRSACALNGSVYREGQVADVQANDPPGTDEESGENSVDEEICVDVDESVPGGEWMDVDNESINQYLKGEEGTYTDDDTETYDGYVRDNASYSGDGVKWFTNDYSPAREVELSPFNPLNYSDGYALEDDVGPGIEHSADEGPIEERFTPNAVYSFFEEGRIEDDRTNALVESGTKDEIFEGNVFQGISVRMRVGYANGTTYTAHGETNSQDQENVPESVDFDITKWKHEINLNDSTIDPREDTWAIANRTDAVVGPTGKIYMNGSCYGTHVLDADGYNVTKGEKAVGNSYAMSLDVNGDGTSRKRGAWVNPDSTPKSALSGIMSCDLNATDWGYGYNTSDGDDLQVIRGDARTNGYSEPEGHVVLGDIPFDSEQDPVGQPQNNLQQYPDACGDDRNEYLIREHKSDKVESEHDPSLTGDNIYACADRITDCVYNGSVYSMGQTADVSGTGEEKPVDSTDADICVDTDKSIPGGEWHDPDNSTIQDIIIGGDVSEREERPSTYDGKPTFERRSGGVRWFNTSYGSDLDYPIREAVNSPWNDVDYRAGFAFEDDCDERLAYCEESGHDLTHKEGVAVFGPFEEGRLADDGRDVDGDRLIDGYHIRTWVNGSAEHGAQNSQQFENVYEDLPQLNDSTIDPDEDTWAISSKPYYAVGPTGRVYENGSCYGGDNPDFKAGTIMANSYVYAHDVDGDGVKEGDWVDPDRYEEAILKGQETCGLGELDDWGLGYRNASRDELRFIRGEEEGRSIGYDDTPDWKLQVVSGPITFDNRSINGGKEPDGMVQDDLPQYGNACGDDQYEHLIREHTSLEKTNDDSEVSNKSDEHIPTLERENIYVCVDRISDCAYNGTVYSQGQLADVSDDNEAGDNSTDLEVCIDTDKRIPGGEWHDVDNVSWNQHLKGEKGTYVEDSPSTYEYLVGNDTSKRNHWFTDENTHALEVEDSPFNPLNYSDGYALEDDVGPGVDYATDIGKDLQRKPGIAVYNSFVEDEGEDDENILDGRAVRLYVGYANGTASPDHYETNNQSNENAGDLNFSFSVPDWTPGDNTIELNDSTIQPREDTWAIANRTDAVVGPTGKVYMDGRCYGGIPDASNEEWKTKNETVMANSLAYSMEANADGNNEGVWINPDSTNETLLQGGFSCELNTSDWGMGYDMGPGSELTAIETSEANVRTPGYEPSDLHAVSGPITFDIETDPGPRAQRDITQYPNACGDDQGEFLIREHTTPKGNEYNESLQNRENIYVCADRISDCAYNGEVYSEGQTVDISNASIPAEDPEKGDNINDPEICLDLNQTIPGGEWYDMDNNWTVKSRIDEVGYKPERTWDNMVYFNNTKFFGESPGTDWKNQTHLLNRTELDYFNSTSNYSGEYDYYSPRGYAREDDCGPWMKESGTGPCGDVGPDTQNTSWFNAGNISYVPGDDRRQEGAPQDNYDNSLDFKGKHNKIDDSSDQFEPGAETERNWNLSDVYGPGYKIYDSRDSTPGPDHWALTRFLNYSIDNRGNAYAPGTEDRAGCFYRPGVERRTHLDNETVSKKDKVFGNSFANASDYDSDGVVEGVWEDPDEIRLRLANFSCDLTGPDKGYGYDNGSNDGEFKYKDGDNSTKVVLGDIAFAVTDGKTGSFEQEPPVCGDDHKEYLIEELGETTNSLENEGRFGCGTDYDDCVSRTGGEYALYRNGDYVNTEEAGEDFGRVKNDDEICQQTTGDKYGVWYDQDYSKEFCRDNDLYGRQGARWLNKSYIEKYPYSVADGINDDLNPYIYEKESGFIESLQGNASRYENLADKSGYTPVPTGKYVNRTVDDEYENFSPSDQYFNYSATAGFCGGDDLGENVVVQESSTELLRSNYSVVGIADNADDCVLDGRNYEEIDHEKRKIYDEGDNVTIDFGQSQRTAACYSGTWYADWPVVFLQDNVTVEEETSRDISFKIINIRDTRTTYDVSLQADDDISPFTTFTRFESTEFEAEIPAESTQRYNVEVYGQSTSIGPEDITVYAESITGDINGTDTVTVDVIQEVDSTGPSQQTSEVPGIGGIQLVILMLLAYITYYRRIWD